MESVEHGFCAGHFFFNDAAPTEIYTLSLHDALPISMGSPPDDTLAVVVLAGGRSSEHEVDRKSTRLNSSHLGISYGVFCLQKNKKQRLLRRQARRRGCPSGRSDSASAW